MLFMNNYIMLLIMKEWFCLNALWKVKRFHEWKEVSDEKKSRSLKIRVSEDLLYFKDKEPDEKVLVFYKDKTSDESTSLC